MHVNIVKSIRTVANKASRRFIKFPGNIVCFCIKVLGRKVALAKVLLSVWKNV